MKLRLLVKSMMMLLLVIVGFHFVSMSHLQQPVHHGKVLAVEDDASSEIMNLQEDGQKHGFFAYSILVKDSLILVVAMIFLCTASTKARRKLKQFLYSVYYQSSYFSKNHLFTT
ncbi:hypothetical protein WQ54_12180 [Bacillus sp. SA1-12]|uniref:hypothetical protein n=1 Tax=Bacillus sp. SA1-12 TaxID=1455638 RepID=UPI00062532E9|nr:hypothetical protein [Bacillus sp. SA1-12]KKI91881.1 hypothetical protein WQ54_12180 [Bacillus sp. SA1-12]